MREDIGNLYCPFHNPPRIASVRVDRNKKYYYYCFVCGPVNPHGVDRAAADPADRDDFQNWIVVNARLYGAKGKGNAKAKPDGRGKSGLEQKNEGGAGEEKSRSRRRVSVGA